ncbi:MAG: hypothetical protein JNK05_25910 [Myxococcales bacterium]|nr:hypothetical protein [Myxococcales bacterium]
MSYPQGPTQGAPQQLPPHSTLAIAAFIVAMVGFVGGIVPYVGFLGTIGLVMAIVDKVRQKDPAAPKRHIFSTIAIVFGVLATIGAIMWAVFISWLNTASSRGSCPHLYSFDGQRYQLDADLASAALYRGAEREDTDRLESLRAVDGQYRVRLQNDLQEIDHIDRLSLLVTDAPTGAEVLPSADGTLYATTQRTTPIESTRTLTTDAHGARVERLAVRWNTRPQGRLALVVRGRNTQFAEDALVRYLATMGRGLEPLLRMRSDEGCACYRQYLDEEIQRLGLPLAVDVRSSHRAAPRVSVSPIGPAVLRSFVIPLDERTGNGVSATLDAQPRFWEIASVELATIDPTTVETHELSPSAAVTQDGRDVRATLSNSDGVRLSLTPGQSADIRFDAPSPPAAGRDRTVLVRLRGYYDLPIGGTPGVNAFRLVAHRLGWISLPAFARTIERNSSR